MWRVPPHRAKAKAGRVGARTTQGGRSMGCAPGPHTNRRQLAPGSRPLPEGLVVADMTGGQMLFCSRGHIQLHYPWQGQGEGVLLL